ERRLQHVLFARSRERILGAQRHALDDAAVAHLEDLDDEACGPDLETEYVAVAELDGGHLLLSIVQRLHGAHGVAQLRRLLEPLAFGGIDHAALERSEEHTSE